MGIAARCDHTADVEALFEKMDRSGRILTVGDLAREYDFTDYDGRQPPTFLIPDEDSMD